MKPAAPSPRPTEIELKLALPTSDRASLARRLARVPVLARRKPTRQHLHNVYYDTPDQLLRQSRVALRLRRVGDDANPQWLQTLKTGDQGQSALSQRGEWEVPAPNATLALDGLDGTPWSGIDPEGTVFGALVPAFSTSFERTTWLVRRRDRSVVEVSLDLGQIVAGQKTAPICELELELLAGQPAALFDLAQQIASSIAVLPANMSKAERGYALTQDLLGRPRCAQPPKLTGDPGVSCIGGCVLREAFCQFTANLIALGTSDDPEVVHQARVGWRRFRSALRLFRPALDQDAVPSWNALKPLLGSLGQLRDLDVASSGTLPPLADAFAAGDGQRADAWNAMTQALQQAAHLERTAVLCALQKPAVGAALLVVTQWLEELCLPDASDHAGFEAKVALRPWSRRRLDRLHKKLNTARKDTDSPDRQHRVRILAKRLRYGIEALRAFLPKRRAKRWYAQAAKLQLSLGAARDVMQVSALVAQLGADPGLVEFLRGIAAGQARAR